MIHWKYSLVLVSFRYDLWYLAFPNGTRNTQTAGLAYLTGACDEQKVSISEHTSSTILAHELGHK